MPAIVVREVPPSETRELRRAVLRPNLAIEELAAHEPPDAFAAGAFEDGELVGVGVIGREGGENAWRIRGMATAPGARGRGAGTLVLNTLVEHAQANGAERIWCNARVGARTLYERAGFSVVSAEFELPGIGPHLVMERRVG